MARANGQATARAFTYIRRSLSADAMTSPVTTTFDIAPTKESGIALGRNRPQSSATKHKKEDPTL